VLLVVAALLTLVAVAAAAAGLVVAAILWLCVRHPGAATLAALTLAAAGTGGLPAAAALWVLTVAGLLLLRAHRRQAFDRHVLRHWRRTVVYAWRWRRVMRACDLARPEGRLGRHRAPRLGSVRSTRWMDVLSIRPLDGQGADSFAARGRDLAESFGALACHAHDDATGVVRLEVRRGDPLQGLCAVPPVARRPDPTALPLGRREDGDPWTLSLRDGHVLVVGAPVTARSVVWALLRALAAPVGEGAVEVWALDGSGGIGLAPGAPMFAGTAVDPHGATALVGRLTAGPHRRRPASGQTRPPLALLVAHDLGRWSSTTERRTLEALAGALDLAIDYGAAVGLVVVATAPAVTGDLAVRFPQRITLGSQAAGDRRTPADVGTAAVGGAVTRVRVHRIDDHEMSAIAAAFPARSRVGDVSTDGALARRAAGWAGTAAAAGTADGRPGSPPPTPRRDKARTG
jgi:S-DNA-T family DNA segregation ATPase FtsK/SpoIIIE